MEIDKSAATPFPLQGLFTSKRMLQFKAIINGEESMKGHGHGSTFTQIHAPLESAFYFIKSLEFDIHLT